MNKERNINVAGNLDQKAVAVIKGLILDATRKANSGHPGGAMSSADYAYILFKEFLNFSPGNPDWFNRDRFLLSAGHESMLLYSLLTLIGYLSIEDLKQFRQYGSLTPGHPESGLTPGVEATTGPLGQGVGMAGGMAVAEVMLSQILGKEIMNHFTYVLAGDGDLQEPVALGAAALMGHLGLGRLILYYDRNRVQISGPISRADSTDIARVFDGFGWHVLEIDGHNHRQIREAIVAGQKETGRPTIIIGDTTMARGTATREGDPETHGAPLPPEEIAATKRKLGLPADETFCIPEEVLWHFQSRFPQLKQMEIDWQHKLEEKLGSDGKFRQLWDVVRSKKLPAQLRIPDFSNVESLATRAAFGKVLAELADQLPNLTGGSADLEPSNSTRAFMQKVGDFSREDPAGRNLAFGVREFPMGAMLNGMALHGGLYAFGATFLVFADYERPALRLSAMQKVPVLHVFTHDSFYVGEDGPTHQPVEQLASLRAIPNFLVIRPADATETAVALQVALEQKERPTALALTRQSVPVINRSELPSADNLRKGGYIIYGNENEKPDIILIATGSEVHLALRVAAALDNYKVRVVSMPSTELFDEQPEDYRLKILPPDVQFRVAIEAGVTFGWEKYTGLNGFVYGLNRYGNSAPFKSLEEAYGFTAENLVPLIEEKYLAYIERSIF